MLQLIAHYGTPARVCRDRAQAESLLHHARRGVASPTAVEAILHSAQTSLGVPATSGEQHLLQVLAEELLRTRKALQGVQRRIVKQVDEDPQLQLLQ